MCYVIGVREPYLHCGRSCHFRGSITHPVSVLIVRRQERHSVGGPGTGFRPDRQDDRPHHVRCPRGKHMEFCQLTRPICPIYQCMRGVRRRSAVPALMRYQC